MIEERTEERKAGFARAINDAKLALFIWRSPGCSHVNVRELDTDQIERAITHFDKRRYECVEELARRDGEPKPNFWVSREFEAIDNDRKNLPGYVKRTASSA